MLKITIPKREMFNEETQEFFSTKEYTIQLEHSLVSLSKWESKWHKPFLSNKAKSIEETIDYIRCMTITQNIPNEAYNYLTQDNIVAINKYIDDPMTATTFPKDSGIRKNDIITSELIYYWMTALNVPMECQKWHLNRLLTLIKVCNVKQTPGKKMSNREIISRNAALNAARRKQMHSKG